MSKLNIINYDYIETKDCGCEFGFNEYENMWDLAYCDKHKKEREETLKTYELKCVSCDLKFAIDEEQRKLQTKKLICNCGNQLVETGKEIEDIKKWQQEKN